MNFPAFATVEVTLSFSQQIADHVISTGRQMMNLVLNICFDFFSRQENQI